MPYSRSHTHAWQTFFSRATAGEMHVSFHRLCSPCHRKAEKGEPEILHCLPMSDLSMRTYGFGPRHLSQMIGKSSPRLAAVGVDDDGPPLPILAMDIA